MIKNRAWTFEEERSVWVCPLLSSLVPRVYDLAACLYSLSVGTSGPPPSCRAHVWPVEEEMAMMTNRVCSAGIRFV